MEQVIRYSTEGSMEDGSKVGRCLGLETHLDVESDEPPEKIRELVRVGKQMCYTEQALINPVPVRTYTRLNGEELQLDENEED